MDETNDALLEELKKLNEQVYKQNSTRHSFVMGIIYGIGFVIGSAVIATLGLGIVLPFFGSIPAVHDNYVRGAALVRPN